MKALIAAVLMLVLAALPVEADQLPHGVFYDYQKHSYQVYDGQEFLPCDLLHTELYANPPRLVAVVSCANNRTYVTYTNAEPVWRYSD